MYIEKLALTQRKGNRGEGFLHVKVVIQVFAMTLVLYSQELAYGRLAAVLTFAACIGD